MEIIAEQQYMIQGATVTGKYIIEIAQRHAEQLQKWRAKRSKAYHSKKKHSETKTDVSENEEVPTEPETNTENVSETLTFTDIPAEAQQSVAETFAQTDASVSETNSEEKIEGETLTENVSEITVQPDTQPEIVSEITVQPQLDTQTEIVSETRAQMEDTSDKHTIVSESSRFPAHIRTDFLEEYQQQHGELTQCHEGSMNYRTEDGKIFYGIPRLT